MPASGTCAVCGSEAGQQCAGCKVVFYCGREHQRTHWPQHRAECRPLRLVEDSRLGRHLVAARDIKAGELLLRETPIVLEKLYRPEDEDSQGPKVISRPVCLGCCKPADVASPCAGCGWPLCGAQCREAPEHHKECALMRSCGYRASITDPNRKFPDYVCIAPLRILLMPEDKRRKVLELQSHLNQRRNTPLYTLLKTNVVGFIRERLGLANKFTEDDILEICGIFDTNAFEVQPVGGVKVRGLYLFAAMMAHDCRPNTRHVCDSTNTMMVVSTVDIKKGESVTTTYTNTLWSTPVRRAHLKSAKCFECECARCRDPTELGTYLGSIICSRCAKGRVVSTAPLQENAAWRCDGCGHEMSVKQIDWGNQALKQEIEKLDKTTPKELEEFLEKYNNILHPMNTHALQVRHALSQIYGNATGYTLTELNESQLERKVSLSHELLDAMQVLEPGMSRSRGLLLFELQAAMAMQAKLDFDAERITKERAQEVLGDAMTLLQQATLILRAEPGMEKVLQERLASLASHLEIELDKQPAPPRPSPLIAKPPATASDTDMDS